MNLSVSTLLHYLKNKLDTDKQIQNIIVAGEISNFHHHQSGHLYFSLKDDLATISCVMFRFAASSLNFKPKNGDKVLVKANTSIFEASGQLQLYVVMMKLDGIGELFLQFEKLKQKLEAGGYFLVEHKKVKPAFPLKIAVLVGDKSAALSDIQTNFKNRWPIAKVDYYPVLVQGNQASKDIINQLLKVDELNYDAIILARGGGSFEDLFAFNDEQLAYTIFNLKTFIITGIGHEQDFTIADFVADLRSPTPTAAVVMLTPDYREVQAKIDNCLSRISKSMQITFNQKREKLQAMLQSRIFTVDKYLLQDRIMKLEFLKTKLYNSIEKRQTIVSKINSLNTRSKTALFAKIQTSTKELALRELRIKQVLGSKLERAKNLNKRLSVLLEAYSFENVLKRGYALMLKDGKLIHRKQELVLNQDYELKMYDGSISVTYKEDLLCQKKNSKIK